MSTTAAIGVLYGLLRIGIVVMIDPSRSSQAAMLSADLVASGLWLASRINGVIGAAELVRRADPRDALGARVLLVGFALEVVTLFAWRGVLLCWADDAGPDRIHAMIAALGYAQAAASVVLFVGWAMVTRDPSIAVLFGLATAIASPFPCFDPITLLGVTQWRGQLFVREAAVTLQHVVMVAAVVFAARRTSAPPAVRRAGAPYLEMAIAAVTAAAAFTVLALDGGSSAPPRFAQLAAVGALVWLASAIYRAAPADAVHVASRYAVASAAWLIAAGILAYEIQLGTRAVGVVPPIAAPPAVVPAFVAAGVGLACSGASVLGWQRGADRFARRAGHATVPIVLAGVVIGTSLEWSVPVLTAACAAFVLGLGSATFRAAQLALAGGELPTATLRS